jgi:hypothetical protein
MNKVLPCLFAFSCIFITVSATPWSFEFERGTEDQYINHPQSYAISPDGNIMLGSEVDDEGDEAEMSNELENGLLDEENSKNNRKVLSAHFGIVDFDEYTALSELDRII